jgi:glycosyltransferase involved in cell wall biosynthesis
MSKITVFTPTYNRADLLQNLYESLQKQTCPDFEWLIIDDGSTDNTAEVVSGFFRQSERHQHDDRLQRIDEFDESKSLSVEQTDVSKANAFRGAGGVHYFKKENGGKHTALNLAFQMAKCELLFIVDSDDVITPDAIETMKEDWEQVKAKGLCGISYLRGYSATEVIGDEHPQDHVIDNFINLRYNKDVGGDKAEVWVTDCLRQIRFPEFKGEKFLGEGYIWSKLAKKYDMLFVNKIIYITEYHSGGLSQSGRRMRIHCPLGGIENSLEHMSREYKLSFRVKETLLYVAYSHFAHHTLCQIMNRGYRSLTAICLVPGYLLYKYWKKKYDNAKQ